VKVESQDADAKDVGVQMEDGEAEKVGKEVKKGAAKKGAKKKAKVTKEVKVKKELKNEQEEEEEEEEPNKEVKEEVKEEVVLSEVSTFPHIVDHAFGSNSCKPPLSTRIITKMRLILQFIIIRNNAFYSQFELRRRETIASNAAFMKSLGLDQLAGDLDMGDTKAKAKRATQRGIAAKSNPRRKSKFFSFSS
jgi:hypothetical protein